MMMTFITTPYFREIAAINRKSVLFKWQMRKSVVLDKNPLPQRKSVAEGFSHDDYAHV